MCVMCAMSKVVKLKFNGDKMEYHIIENDNFCYYRKHYCFVAILFHLIFFHTNYSFQTSSIGKTVGVLKQNNRYMYCPWLHCILLPYFSSALTICYGIFLCNEKCLYLKKSSNNENILAPKAKMISLLYFLLFYSLKVSHIF